MGDSHTCTHGACGAFAAGVGTTDLAVGILKGVCAFHYPETRRIDIRGTLKKGVYAKDVILHVRFRPGAHPRRRVGGIRRQPLFVNGHP